MNSVYSKHFLLDNFGAAGQAALGRARVLIVGVGGLGCACAEQLVAMGVGAVTLVDGDEVSESNLARQLLFRSQDIGKSKCSVARDFLKRLRADCDITMVEEFLSPKMCEELFDRVDVVVDASDNFDTKFLVNAASVKFSKPLVWANAQKWEGQWAVFSGVEGPCYQCFQSTKPSFGNEGACNELGVLGVVPQIIGGYQALEVVKVIAQLFGVDRTPRPRWATIWSTSFRDNETVAVQLSKRAGCEVCGSEKKNIVLPSPHIGVCAAEPPASTFEELKEIYGTALLCVDVRELNEAPILSDVHIYSWPLSRLESSPEIAWQNLQIECAARQIKGLAFFCAAGMRSRAAFGRLQSRKALHGASSLPRGFILNENAADLNFLK